MAVLLVSLVVFPLALLAKLNNAHVPYSTRRNKP